MQVTRMQDSLSGSDVNKTLLAWVTMLPQTMLNR